MFVDGIYWINKQRQHQETTIHMMLLYMDLYMLYVTIYVFIYVICDYNICVYICYMWLYVYLYMLDVICYLYVINIDRCSNVQLSWGLVPSALVWTIPQRWGAFHRRNPGNLPWRRKAPNDSNFVWEEGVFFKWGNPHYKPSPTSAIEV